MPLKAPTRRFLKKIERLPFLLADALQVRGRCAHSMMSTPGFIFLNQFLQLGIARPDDFVRKT